jgi:hypothetical protein
MKTTKVYGDYEREFGKFRVRSLRADPAERTDEMEVHFRRGSRAPRVGDVLSVWVDVSTPYAVAPDRHAGGGAR